MNPTLHTESAPSPAPKNHQPSLRVVAIGGGTGLSTLLRGLKRYVPAPAASRRATDAQSPASPTPNTAPSPPLQTTPVSSATSPP